MKLGYCADLTKLSALAEAGIHNIELSVPYIMSWSESELQENLRILAASPVKVESCNVLVHGFSLYDDPDLSQSRAYLSRVLPRLAQLGIHTAVFGSGTFRRMPEGMTFEEARPHLMDFLRLLSSLCTPFGITIAIEPLISRSTNTLLTARETAPLVRELNLPNIRLLIDFGHFFNENELLHEIEAYGDLLVHIHIANPINRRNPLAGDGIDYTAWISALKKVGYDGLLVSECIPETPFEAGLQSFVHIMHAANAAT